MPSVMPLTPVCRPRIQARPKAVTNIGSDRMRWKVSIQRPGFGSRRRRAGTKPSSRNGRARPSPSPAKTASAPIAGRTRAAPNAAPMNGPVQGVATKAASAPVKKAPRSALAPRQPVAHRDDRQLEQAGKAQCDGGEQQQQQQDHARILKLERPIDRRAARPQGEQQAAEREAGRDHARRISQRLAPGAGSPSRPRGPGSVP